MGRDFGDIPEVFRRAFDEEEWGGRRGEDEEAGRGGRRPPGADWRPFWRDRRLWLLALAALVLLGGRSLATLYTEWLWFEGLGYLQLWLRQWGLRLALFAAGFLLAAAILGLNWRYAFRRARRLPPTGRTALLDLPGVGWAIGLLALFLALVFAGAAEARWEEVLLFLNGRPFGAVDPIFQRDLSFYLFDLPLLGFVQIWILSLLGLALLGAALIHAADDWPSWQPRAWQASLSAPFRRQSAGLLALIFLLWAVGLWLGIYRLNYSTRGVVFGPGYADIHAELPALYIQLALMLLLALAAAANFFRPQLRLLAIAAGLWLAAALLAGQLYPALLQRLVVEPNELAREQPYIANNIALTRQAFKLDTATVRPFGDVQELTAADLAQNQETLQNVRIWDYQPLQQTYSQLQELRPYYGFSPIDIDRYPIEGQLRQVMLAGRELDKESLTAPSWVNLKLQFTHGYGVVMNPVDEVTAEGQPVFFIRDLPPVSTVSIPLERPEIYFGERMADPVYVASALEEFDYPVADENAYSSYAGRGGVALSNPLRRLAFALRFGEINLIFSQYITPQTRALFHRQIEARVRHVAPFLALDSDPYLVVADGRLIWLLDAYTLSDDFPYATPSQGGHNYIRNSVKIALDAYDGALTFYLADPNDPLIAAYGRAFPGLLRPLEEMPAALRAHIRYPRDLFHIQARQYLKYHMTEVQVFYNQEDAWAIPMELFEDGQQPMEAYYVNLALHNEAQPEFLLIQPFTPAGKNNMVAWMAARNDAPHYGELVVYQLPKQELIFGPLQVEARIDQDPQISAQLTLWNQRGSQVVRGNLLVIPMNSSFLFVEPLYLLSEASQLPELQRVIVASGDRIAMRETLSEALAALLAGEGAAAELPA
ncbi:MAG: UPF0182 family protein, partial [Candidatus Promineifilaceae bacterium]